MAPFDGRRLPAPAVATATPTTPTARDPGRSGGMMARLPGVAVLAALLAGLAAGCATQRALPPVPEGPVSVPAVAACTDSGPCGILTCAVNTESR